MEASLIEGGRDGLGVDLEADGAGEREGDAGAEVEREVDLVLGVACEGLADEVEDSAFCGATDEGVDEVREQGRRSRPLVRDALYGEAAHARPGDGIGGESDGGDDGGGAEGEAGHLACEGWGSGAVEKVLIDAEEPEGRKPFRFAEGGGEEGLEAVAVADVVQQEQHQGGDGEHAKDGRHQTEGGRAEDAEQEAAEGEDQKRGEEAGEENGDEVREKLTEEVDLADQRKHEGAQQVAADEEEGEEAGEGDGFADEELRGLERERGEDEEVEAIGEEHVPLKDGDGAEDDEGEEDEEVLVLHGAPSGTRASVWI